MAYSCLFVGAGASFDSDPARRRPGRLQLPATRGIAHRSQSGCSMLTATSMMPRPSPLVRHPSDATDGRAGSSCRGTSFE